jgi:hypothetical protein
MEQQTLRIGHKRLPPPFLRREQYWPERVREGGFEHPVGSSHRATGARAAGANPVGIVPWASRLHDRASCQVVRHPLLTIDCKREILQRWAWDEYLLDLANAEGMPEGEPSRLDEVKAALRLVTRERSPDSAAPAAFIVPYHWDETALAA